MSNPGPHTSGGERHVRLDGAMLSNFGDQAKIVVSTKPKYLPQPKDENERIKPYREGHVLVVAGTSTKPSCQLDFPGLSCALVFIPALDEVLLEIKQLDNLPDLVCVDSPPREAGKKWKALDTTSYAFVLYAGVWRLSWKGPSWADHRIYADIMVLRCSYGLHLPPDWEDVCIVPWENPFVTIDMGQSVTIEAPSAGEPSPSENYKVTCTDSRHNGNSTVFTAVHTSHPGRRVEVKVLRLSMPNSHPTVRAQKMIREWINEVNITRRLNHPNIARYISSDARIGLLVTESHPMPPLDDVSQMSDDYFFKGHEGCPRRILHDMASALDYLAAQNIVHNDVTPGNILYRRGRGCILIDFGSATSLGQSTTRTPPYYVCPEYARGRGRGFGSDVFSLGIVMLFVRGLIPLPEKTVSPWNAVTAGQDERSPCGRRARRWLDKLDDARSHLPRHSGTNSLVFRMLDRDPDTRITARKLVAKT